MSTKFLLLNLFVIISTASFCCAMSSIARKKAGTGVRNSAQKVNIPKRKYLKRITSKEIENFTIDQLNAYKSVYKQVTPNLDEINKELEVTIKFNDRAIQLYYTIIEKHIDIIELFQTLLQPRWYDRIFPFLKKRRIKRAKDEIQKSIDYNKSVADNIHERKNRIENEINMAESKKELQEIIIQNLEVIENQLKKKTAEDL
jgi:hypothetical protein